MPSSDPEALARAIASRLAAHGNQAFLVGGCVRDMLLGAPPKDWDVATDATPDRVLSLFPSASLVGAHFGVVLVHEEGASVEVATFRSDGEYSDGRHPECVRYETDPQADALRRDFTINAMFLDPATDAVIDFTGGRADLERRLVRAIGDPVRRFGEDHLRLLRAVRFAARLDFEIEPATFAAMRLLAREVATVASERVRDELTRILTSGRARRGFELLDASGLLAQVLPEVAAMKGVEQPPEFHPEGDVWIHTRMLLENLRDPSPTLAWAALLHDVGKPPTFRRADRIRFDGHAEAGVAIAHDILRRLRFPNDQAERIERMIADHMKFKDVQAMRESTLKRFVRQPGFDEHMELHRLDCMASNGYTSSYNFVQSRLADLTAVDLKPAPLVSGRDLIALGFQPGPAFTTVLAAVEDAQLEGALQSREDALRFAAAQFETLAAGL